MWRETAGVTRPRWIQLGIVSGGEGNECGIREFPGRYVRLDSREIMSFIGQNTGNLIVTDNPKKDPLEGNVLI